MPLLLLFGQPLTGKSKTAALIQQEAVARGLESVVIDLGLMGCTIKDLTGNIGTVRTRLRQLVAQYLSKERLVIVDHTNHTKSFRYELFCIARERKTTNCIVSCYTDRPMDENELSACAENPLVGDECLWTYPRYVDICSRFESLLTGAKADQPIFNASTSPQVILDYLYSITKTPGKAKLKSLLSAVTDSAAPPTSEAVSHEAVRRITKDIVATIFNTQASAGPISMMLTVYPPSVSVTLPYTAIPIAQLHSLRRSFLQNAYELPLTSEDSVAGAFAKYLSKKLQLRGIYSSS
ncbi:RNA polymerase II elongator complex associated protein KTI12 [Giardia duodenalis]|uniref:DRL1 protein n=2 Tax=Giardia intestinalis TaxID=5741 RepID=C6M0A3_GIAIB|nr:DRL1 protein [Giardia intestinalis ATCC 50581]ESU44672.1 RNA polymerase II elongator complex associated protein KTI12 [Giardia intestinalis]